MKQLLEKFDKESLFVLAGDIYQIESIDFGNWFFYAKEILPPKAWVELNSTWRTKDPALKDLWEEVRFKKPLITEKLVIDGPFSENIGKSIFNKMDEDEVVLCLNYDGRYGLNNINSYFQDANPSAEVYRWREWRYKIGDRILFNESRRFPQLYNNLKGEIIGVKQDENNITFVVEVQTVITAVDARNADFEILDWTDNDTTIIKFFVTNNVGASTEEERELARMRAIVPFQLAYAVSIHKAQGLEYNSVKIVIPSSNAEKISHGIFYTAITRAKEKLKIYWSSDTMQQVISRFKNDDVEQKSLELIKQKMGIK
jgi:ATP-dependent exoDNAse (exonuclease V) alpha subunit